MLGRTIKQLILLSAIAITSVACSTASSSYYAREKSDRSSDHSRPIGGSVSYYDGYNEYYDPHRFHTPKPKKFERDGYTRYDHQRLYDHDPRDRDRDSDSDSETEG